MKRMWTTLCSTAALGLWPTPALPVDTPDARSIMEQVDRRDDGETRESELEMVLTDKSGSTRVRRYRAFRKDYGDDTRGVLFFLEPADTRRTGFLTYDYDGAERDDDQWIYLPALGKSKRLAAGDKAASFFGSDFSFADLSSLELNSYDFSLMKEGTVGTHPVWLIRAVPRDAKEIERTGYKEIVYFVRKDNYFIVRALFRLERGGKAKYFEVKELTQIEGIWVATEVEMSTRVGGEVLHRTTLINKKLLVNPPIEDSTFSLRRLEQGE